MAESSKADINRLKYSGKELVTHRGYDAYDFGPRNHLPTLCLFDNPDLLQEKFYGLHPSNYCAANPIRNIDSSEMFVPQFLVFCLFLLGSENHHSEIIESKKYIYSY